MKSKKKLSSKDRTYWTGSIADVVFSSIYLMTKHKNICYPFNPKHAWDYNDIMIMYSFKNESVVKNASNAVIEKISTNEYYEYENTKDKDLVKKTMGVIRKQYSISFPGGSVNFIKMLKSCKKRYIMVPIYFEWVDGAHANILLIDTKLKTVERFEPYGKLPLFFYLASDEFDKKMESEINKIFSQKYKYYTPLMFCPERSLQTINEQYGKEYYGDPVGFCAAWCAMYIDLRLSETKLSRSKLVEKLLKRNKTNMKRFIRKYTMMLDVHRIEMLKTLGAFTKNSKCKCISNSCSIPQITDECFEVIYNKYLIKIFKELNARA